MYNTLFKRFGCRKTVDKMKMAGQTVIFEKDVILMEVDSFKDNEEFKEYSRKTSVFIPLIQKK